MATKLTPAFDFARRDNTKMPPKYVLERTIPAGFDPADDASPVVVVMFYPKMETYRFGVVVHRAPTHPLAFNAWTLSEAMGYARKACAEITATKDP